MNLLKLQAIKAEHNVRIFMTDKMGNSVRLYVIDKQTYATFNIRKTIYPDMGKVWARLEEELFENLERVKQTKDHYDDIEVGIRSSNGWTQVPDMMLPVFERFDDVFNHRDAAVLVPMAKRYITSKRQSLSRDGLLSEIQDKGLDRIQRCNRIKADPLVEAPGAYRDHKLWEEI
ncbi:MAG: hypothetical protein GY776_07010 [Alteromonas sp.]|nr:hypothetical protein [Alteromonas sp.]